ncbi:MAG: hypothetical protein VYB65_09860 [Myxococcota bacterium]|nr:hypothetical protein [Myxococcota bacterium]
MNLLRTVSATLALTALTSACGLPVPFEWTSNPQQVNVDELLGENTFNVPAGEDAEAAQDLIQQYLSEFSDEENWPEDLAEVKIDVPLLQTFPVDLTQNEQVAAAADKLEAVAVDNLEVRFLANSINYSIPSFHFFTVDDGVTMPDAESFDMNSLPAGVQQIGSMTGVEAKSTGSFALEYSEGGKQLLSDAVLARKFNIAIYTQVTFDSTQEGGLVPTGAAEVQAHIKGRILSGN